MDPTFDAILTFNKQTGEIESLHPSLDIPYFLNTRTEKVKSIASVFNENGVEIGFREVDIFDPIVGDYVQVKTPLNSNTDIAIISTKTRQEILEHVLDEHEYPTIPYSLIDKTGNAVKQIEMFIPPQLKKIRRGINTNGEVILEGTTRKVLDGYEYITVLTHEEQNFDFSEHLEGEDGKKQYNLTKVFFDLHQNYKIENNSLVKSVANSEPIVQQ
jgi:hypothetical protein